MATLSALDDDAVLSIASYGAPGDLLRLALTCRHFGAKVGATSSPEWSLMDEAARCMVERALSAWGRACVPLRDGESWMGRIYEMSQMTTTLRLTPISPSKARAVLVRRGIPVAAPTNDSEVADAAFARHVHGSNIITLKVCKPSEDVVDLSGEDVDARGINVVDLTGEDDDGGIDVVVLDGEDVNGSINEGVVKHASAHADGTIVAGVSLGRGRTTGVASTWISRRLCEVTLTWTPSSVTTAASLSMHNVQNTQCVHLNGIPVTRRPGVEISLQDESIISLDGPTGFAYKVSTLRARI